MAAEKTRPADIEKTRAADAEKYRSNCMKKLLVVIVVLVMLVSCGDGGGGGDSSVGYSVISQTKTFWAQRADNNEFYELTAELLAEGLRCEIWAEKGSGVTAAEAQSVANIYTGNIYPKMINAFSNKISVKDVGNFDTTMDFVHWFATNEKSGGKLTILLLDIKDEYKKGSNDAFVAGYFWPYDILSNGIPSNLKTNKRDMLYIDIYPMTVGSEIFNRTIAHEMQHLMNFATSLVQRVDNQNYVHPMDTWIDEGLSSAAEYIYLGKHLDDRIHDFNVDATGLIAKGNNFFVWGNRESENQNAVLDDYATVYLFFQWLRLQTGGTNIYKNIIASTESDYKAIVAYATSTGNDWPTILGAWLKANYDRSPSTIFGYRNDTVLNNIKVHYAPAATPAKINLFPGEGVYSYVNSPHPIPPQESIIKYAGLGAVSGSTITSGALLTCNTSTTVYVYDGNGNLISGPVSESGTITGVAAPPNANITTGRSALGGVPSGPFPISAGDMLRRRGYESNFPGMNNLKLLTEAVIE
jgi:hypothetical protein